MSIQMKSETVLTQQAIHWHAGKQYYSQTEGEISGISEDDLSSAKQFVESCSSIDLDDHISKAKVMPTLFRDFVILTINRKSKELVCKRGKTYDEVFERLGIKEQIEEIVAEVTKVTYWSDLPIHQPKWSVIDMHREFSVFMYGDFAVVYSSKIGGFVHDHYIEVVLNLDS